MNTINNFGKALAVTGAMLAADEAQAQMALDQTVNNATSQVYKTIAFANGNENNNPSYNFTGSKNIDVAVSDSYGSRPSFWRSNGSGGGNFVNTAEVGGSTATTIDNEVV